MTTSNVSIATTTGAKGAKLSKGSSFVQSLAKGDDIETIVSNDEHAETPAPIETPTHETAQRAERGSVKTACLELFKELQTAGVPQENWAQIAENRGIVKNSRHSANILRYDFLQIERIPTGNGTGTTISRTTLSVPEAELEAEKMYATAYANGQKAIQDAIEKAETDCHNALQRGKALVERAKENEERIANNAEAEVKKITANVVKMAEQMRLFKAAMQGKKLDPAIIAAMEQISKMTTTPVVAAE